MVLVTYREIKDFDYNSIFRVFISGSSGSGKTSFTKQLLKKKVFDYKRIYYYHPDFHQDCPVDWQDSLDVDVVFRSLFPSRGADFVA